MQEIIVIFILLTSIAIAYLWLYPTFVGRNVRKMAWFDSVIGLVVLGIVALLYMGDDLSFTLFFFETNWIWFTVVMAVVLESPIFFWYLKARGLGKEYRELFRMGNAWGSASEKSVTKQLNDEKWDGLRTIGAKRFLLIGSNVSMIFGTGFLWLVGDNKWAAYSLLHILFLFVFWFLLRTSARLVADAPDEALDERLTKERDRAYLWSYRWLSMLVFALATALLIFAIVNDMNPESDAFNYQLEVTWPQVQAVFWLIAGYTWMLPSMALLAREVNLERRKRQSTVK